MYSRDFLPDGLSFWLVVSLLALVFVLPGQVDARTVQDHALGATPAVAIAFGQESGNIRPFRVAIAAGGAIKLAGPIHLTGGAGTVSRDAVAGLILLAEAERFRTLPSFTACPGALPDLATRYVNIHTATWHHRAGVRGNCLSSFSQLFAVLIDATHASF